MKYCDKYPQPDGSEPCVPPPATFAGLHPLVWVFIVVMGIAAFGAYDHLEDADWDNWSFSEEDDDGHDDDDESDIDDDEAKDEDKPT